jgi:rhodanese-related sulfurtransferase
MSYAAQYAFLALPFGLFLAGCSGSNRAEPRSVSTAAPSARTPDQVPARRIDGAVSGQAARPATGRDDVLGYVVTSDQRHDVTLDEIREHVRNQTAMIIDARGTSAFAEGHVHGAFNMPAGHKEEYIGQLSQRVARDELIIIYCNGPHCDSGDMVYEYLAAQGFSNMRVFKPGWAALSSAKDLLR